MKFQTTLLLPTGQLLSAQEMYQIKCHLVTLSHHQCKRILDLLKVKKSMTVSHLEEKLGLEQSVVSQFLARLRKAGLVKSERDGKFRYYTRDTQASERLLGLVEQVTKDTYTGAIPRIQLAIQHFRALAHDKRMDVLSYVLTHDKTPVKPIQRHLDEEQSRTSHFLKNLRDVGMVSFERDGKRLHYSANINRLNHLATVSADFLT